MQWPETGRNKGGLFEAKVHNGLVLQKKKKKEKKKV
jgi:hypothetical protein